MYSHWNYITGTHLHVFKVIYLKIGNNLHDYDKVCNFADPFATLSHSCQVIMNVCKWIIKNSLVCINIKLMQSVACICTLLENMSKKVKC